MSDPSRNPPVASDAATHDRQLAHEFDRQAARFERAPVQSDPAGLLRLVAFAALPSDALVLDAGCGPGLVSAALLGAGCRVLGCDVSPEMIARARARCAAFGDRARFVQRSIFDVDGAERCDAALSRFVLHHVLDPRAFLRRQVELVQPGGVVIACDHATDPEPARAAWHQEIERARDYTHTRNLTAGELVDLFALAGLRDVRALEEPFTLDFDEWFDRGSPALPKDEVRARLAAGSARTFTPVARGDGGFRIECNLVMVRGVV